MAWDRRDKELIINVSLWETYSSSFVSLVKFGVVSRQGEVLGREQRDSFLGSVKKKKFKP